jgi:hypothetical protein
MNRQADLLEVVLALRSPRRLARGLDRRQQERDQYPDNRDHNQQLDERKTTLADGSARLALHCA